VNDDRFDHSPREELDDALRQAVERVRSQPAPTESLRRSLDKARQIGAVYHTPWRGVGKRALALAALVGVIVFCGEMLRPKPESVVRAYREAQIQQIRDRIAAIEEGQVEFKLAHDGEEGNTGKREIDKLVRTLNELENEGLREPDKAHWMYENTTRTNLKGLADDKAPRAAPDGPVTVTGSTTPRPTIAQPSVDFSFQPAAGGETRGGKPAPVRTGPEQPKSGSGHANPKTPPVTQITSGVFAPPADTGKRVKDLAENWAKLPERDRVKALDAMANDLPPQYRGVIHSYFQQLGRAPDQPDAMRQKLYMAIDDLDQRAAVTSKTNLAAKKLAENWEELAEKDREKAVLLLSDVKEQKDRADKLHVLYLKKAVD
jgi:hypothetical protein